MRSCCRTATCASGPTFRAGRATRWHYALTLPQPAYLLTLVVGPVRRAPRPRREDRRRRLRLHRAGARGRRAPQLRPHRRDDRPLLREDRPALPARALQPDHRPRVHLRRDGEHQRHHADRSDAARRAGRARSRRRRPRLARAGAPVVGRSAHLPRVVRGLAERGVRHLLRVRLARARQGARRGRPRAARRHRRLSGRGRALPAAGGLPAVRRADSPLRRAPLRKRGARPAHAPARAGRRALLARHRPLRAQARQRLGRDARSGARDRRGHRPWGRADARPLDRAPRSSGAGRALELGRGAQGRHAGPDPEAGGHDGDAAVRVFGDRPIRARWRHARRTRDRPRGRAQLRVQAAGAADPGDLRSGRRPPQDDQARQERRTLAPPAHRRRAGDRSGSRGTGAGRSPRPRQRHGAHRGARRRSVLGRSRRRCPRARPNPARRGARRC